MKKSKYYIIEVQEIDQFIKSKLYDELNFTTDFEIEDRFFYAMEFKNLQSKREVKNMLNECIDNNSDILIRIIPITKKISRYSSSDILYVTNMPKNFDKENPKKFIKKFCLGYCKPKKCLCYYSVDSSHENLERLIHFLPSIPISSPIMASYSCIEFPLLRFSRLSLATTEESLASYILKYANCQVIDVKCSKLAKGQKEKYANVLLQSVDDIDKVFKNFNFCTIDSNKIYVKQFLEPEMGEEIKKYEIAVTDLPKNIEDIDFYNQMSQFGRIFDFVLDVMHLIGYVTFIFYKSRKRLLSSPEYHTHYSIVTLLVSNFPPNTTCDQVKNYIIETTNSKPKQIKLNIKTNDISETKPKNKNIHEYGDNNGNYDDDNDNDYDDNGNYINSRSKKQNANNKDMNMYEEEEEEFGDDIENNYEQNIYAQSEEEEDYDKNEINSICDSTEDQKKNINNFNEEEENGDDNKKDDREKDNKDSEDSENSDDNDENSNHNNDNNNYDKESNENEQKSNEFDPNSIVNITAYIEDPPSDPNQIKVSFTLPTFLIQFKDPFSIDFVIDKLKSGLYNNLTVPYAIRYYPRPNDNNDKRSSILTKLSYENALLITPIHADVMVEQIFNICSKYGVILFFQINRKRVPNFCIVKYQFKEESKAAFESINGTILQSQKLSVYSFPISKEEFEHVSSDNDIIQKGNNVIFEKITKNDKRQNDDDIQFTEDETSSSNKINIVINKRKADKSFNIQNYDQSPYAMSDNSQPMPPPPPQSGHPPPFRPWNGAHMPQMPYDPRIMQFNNRQWYQYPPPPHHPMFRMMYRYHAAGQYPYFPNPPQMMPDQQQPPNQWDPNWNWQWQPYMNPAENYEQGENEEPPDRGRRRRREMPHHWMNRNRFQHDGNSDNRNNDANDNNNNDGENDNPYNRRGCRRRGGRCRRHERFRNWREEGNNEIGEHEIVDHNNIDDDRRRYSTERGTWWRNSRGGHDRRDINHENCGECGERFHGRGGCARGGNRGRCCNRRRQQRENLIATEHNKAEKEFNNKKSYRNPE
ncbi:hypothetical protein M9Y10_037400 [Tritrichomonas musculus]|uniref:RRM domain-containing protein n=1 Tax=Tritrichomonas musculus TaxID=1915356 RepID=A0ABR2GSI3_9EUKA